MKKTSRAIFPTILLLVFVGCGSGEEELPLASESVQQAVLAFQPEWPETIKKSEANLDVVAWIKGEDSKGKATGAIGPIVAESAEGKYQFSFSYFLDELNSVLEVTIDAHWKGDLPEECRLVATVTKELLLVAGELQLSSKPEEFELGQDCDKDGLTNLEELQKGLRPDLADSDGDGVGDATDRFPLDPKENADHDSDGIGDNSDNCKVLANAGQEDLDKDGIGDLCDPDIDGDGIPNDLESQRGLNPRNIDTDQDSISDATDNCPFVANTNQSDLDQDKLGDVCDPDMDGDGLSNADEAVWKTDPKKPDSDADGVGDNADNCKTIANTNQVDADKDGFGLACDCNDTVATTFLGANDDPEATLTDSNCDGIDGDATKAIFVSLSGNDTSDGSLQSPVQSIQKGYEKATAQQKDIYVEAGSYNLANLIFKKGVRLFGGYLADGAKPFARRCLFPSACDGAFETILTNSATDSTIKIEDGDGKFFLRGFKITNAKVASDSFIGARTILLKNSQADFQNCDISGSQSSDNDQTTALLVTGNSAFSLADCSVDGGKGRNVSVGVRIESSDRVTLKNNWIHGGNGRWSTGVEVVGASPTIEQNTLQAEGAKFATSLSIENTLGIKLLANALVTGVAEEQRSLYCRGLPPLVGTGSAVVSGNLFTLSPPAGGSAAIFPRVVNCSGEFYFSVENGFYLGSSLVTGNFDDQNNQKIGVQW